MSEEIKDLIEKIQEEGVKTAEEKAKRIEEEARRKAEAIVEAAHFEAGKIAREAKNQAVKIKETTDAALKQAGRDLLVVLKKEINTVLCKLILSSVRNALSVEELAKIIVNLVKNVIKQDNTNVIVTLNREDLEKIEKKFFPELQEEIKKGIILKGSDEVNGGLKISYNADKSYFDFSDKAIAEYISSQLKPKLAEIFKIDNRR